jgi:hypothetical protein
MVFNTIQQRLLSSPLDNKLDRNLSLCCICHLDPWTSTTLKQSGRAGVGSEGADCKSGKASWPDSRSSPDKSLYVSDKYGSII